MEERHDPRCKGSPCTCAAIAARVRRAGLASARSIRSHLREQARLVREAMEMSNQTVPARDYSRYISADIEAALAALPEAERTAATVAIVKLRRSKDETRNPDLHDCICWQGDFRPCPVHRTD
jgi:hypothetical protein